VGIFECCPVRILLTMADRVKDDLYQGPGQLDCTMEP
jgi:hypothetical protein